MDKNESVGPSRGPAAAIRPSVHPDKEPEVVKLPFGKKSSTPQKSMSSAPKKQKKRGSAGVPPSALAQPRRQGNHWANEWVHPDPDPGTPGICGYLNGVKEGEKGHHP